MERSETRADSEQRGRAPVLERVLTLLAELGGPLVLLVIGVLFWSRQIFPGVDLPFWAGAFDAYLDGPDAGAWASSAQAVFDARFEDVDPNRLPTWLLLCAGTMHLFGYDSVLAGHLLNRSLFLLLPLVVYAMGRLGGNRSVGFTAGLLVLLCPLLGQASRRYGVDPAVAFMLTLAMLTAMSVRWHWSLGLLAGVVAGLAAVTHYSTMPFPLAAAVFVIASPGRGVRSWRRAAALLCYIFALGLTLHVVSSYFTLPTRGGYTIAIAGGIASTPNTGLIDNTANEQTILATIRAGLGGALDKSVYNLLTAFLPLRFPWALALVAPWLGVLGAFLIRAPRIHPQGGLLGRLRVVMAHLDLGTGLGLLCCLAPIPVLASVNAPGRYADNLIPFGVLLFSRGLFSLVGGLALVAGRLRPFLDGLVRVLAVPLILGLILRGSLERMDWKKGPPGVPTREMVDVRRLGQAISAHFPVKGGAVCPIWEALAYAGMDLCPHSPCPRFWDEQSFRECLSVVDEECHATDPLPWVVIEGAPGESLPAPRRDLDRWMLEKWPVVETVEAKDFTARILSISRAELREQALPAGPGGPPPEPE